MIVKLETTNVDVGSKESWVYFDGFRKIKQVYLNQDYVKHNSEVYDYLAMNKSEKNNPSVLLICSLNYNKECLAKNEYTILTNQRIYLLNDEGKTIERIN